MHAKKKTKKQKQKGAQTNEKTNTHTHTQKKMKDDNVHLVGDLFSSAPNTTNSGFGSTNPAFNFNSANNITPLGGGGSHHDVLVFGDHFNNTPSGDSHQKRQQFGHSPSNSLGVCLLFFFFFVCVCLFFYECIRAYVCVCVCVYVCVFGLCYFLFFYFFWGTLLRKIRLRNCAF